MILAVHNDLGKLGETIATTYLRNKGYEILELNWRRGRAEVDIIVMYEQTLIFVEVKTRSSVAFGRPEEFVAEAKQKLLDYAANEYIYLIKHEGEIRFDIISVLFNKKQEHTLNHIKDAFWPI